MFHIPFSHPLVNPQVAINDSAGQVKPDAVWPLLPREWSVCYRTDTGNGWWLVPSAEDGNQQLLQVEDLCGRQLRSFSEHAGPVQCSAAADSPERKAEIPPACLYRGRTYPVFPWMWQHTCHQQQERNHYKKNVCPCVFQASLQQWDPYKWSLATPQGKCGSEERKYFFPSIRNSHFNRGWVTKNFNLLWRKANTSHATAYEFCHHYAVTNLNQWTGYGFEFHDKLVYLSKSMGHTTLESTKYYYSIVPGLSEIIKEQTENSSEWMIPEVPLDEATY